MNIETKYKVGDIIYWFCDIDNKIHQAEVLFVNYAGVGYPDINYEVETVCCGEKKTLFIDEYDIIDTDFL
ncbi:hypothetical protein [uncultured Bacteroides sp.]|uniref:hypothetical protein n=1 Tax=uncultured Bacteroides sp. TaxID=162156 RepID=UPI002591F0B5|nr:hypothetical protein [uncultured Bacteroides sp.]